MKSASTAANKKWENGKEYGQTFPSKELKWFFNLRGCLTSLIIRGIQIKTAVGYCFSILFSHFNSQWNPICLFFLSFSLSLSFFFFFSFLSMAIPVAYASSQSRGLIGASAAGLNHSHSNAKSKPRLQSISQLQQLQILNLLNEARDRTSILPDLYPVYWSGS